ncbi:MAG: FG-GAP-like repeat-containing protein, partial [Planctomycetota bacterium]
TLTNVTVSGNMASATGGGLIVSETGTIVTILNSTFSRNDAFQTGGGVKINTAFGIPTVNVKNTIIAGNQSGDGDADVSGGFTSDGNNAIGDIGLASGFINGISDDIVGGAGSTPVTDATNASPIVVTASGHGLSTGDLVRVSGVVGNETANGVHSITVLDANSFELVGSFGSGAYTSGGQVFALVDPRLGPLQNNTVSEDPNRVTPMLEPGQLFLPVEPVIPETHALQPDSPAIDAGNNSGAPATDQRGISRPIDGDAVGGAVTDIGAVELFYTTVSGVVFDDTNGNGVQDPGEFEQSGVTVYYDSNQNGQFDSGEPVAVSGNMSGGDFTLTLVPPGNGVVDIVVPSNSRRTTPTPIVFSVPSAIHAAPATDFSGSVTADFDLDGDLDLAVANTSPDQVTVLLNDGTGGFVSQQYGTLALGTADVVAGDFNGDGFADLASLNTTNASVTVLLNDQFGGFLVLSPAVVAASGDLTAIAVGDFFGSDGVIDLAVTDAGDNVFILANDGFGGMSPQTPVALGIPTSGRGLITGDLNGDDFVDAVAIGQSMNAVFPLFNSAMNQFIPQPIMLPAEPQAVVADDFDRDGLVDFAVSMAAPEGIRVFRNTGNNTFTAVQDLVPGDAEDLQSRDVTGDGLPDLIVGRNFATVTVFQNQGVSGFSPIGTDVGSVEVPRSVEAGDFTGDGRVDVVIAGDDQDSVELLTGLSQTAVISAVSGVPISGTTLAVQQLGSINGKKFHDLNRDGFEDTGEPGLAGVDIYLDLNGNGRLDPDEPITTTTGDDPGTIEIDETGEYQFDGVIPGDYLVSEVVPTGFSQTSPTDPAFFTRELVSTGDEAVAVETVDFNGDGLLDLAVLRAPISPSGSLHLYQGDGNGGFLFVDSIMVGNDPAYVTAGDIDADGNVDFVVSNTPDGTLTVLEFEGGSLQDRTPGTGIPTLPDPTAVRLADLNGDMRPDLVVANGDPGPASRESVVYFPNQSTGAGSFTFGPRVDVGADVTVLAFDLADLDLDGDLDLVAAEHAMPTSRFRAYRNDAGAFTEVGMFDTGLLPLSLEIADFDRNGRLDVAVGAAGSGGTNGEVHVHRSSGDFNWTLHSTSPTGMNPSSMVVADLNQDGVLDIAVTDVTSPADGLVQVLTADPDGSFFVSPMSFSAGPALAGLASGDFDGDGSADLAVTNDVSGQNNVRALMSRVGTRAASVPAGNTISGFDFGNIAQATIQGRKFHDLDEDGVFDMGEPPLEGFTIFVDLDGNGQLDPHEPSTVTDVNGMYTLTGIEAAQNVTISEVVPEGWRQTSPRTLVPRSTTVLPVGEDPEQVALGDLDGDGDLDTVTVNRVANTVSVLLFDSMTGQSVRRDFGTGGSGATDVALADLDGNGSLDIAVSHDVAGTVTVLQNNGSGVFGTPASFGMGAAERLVVGDFTNDMVPDIAFSVPSGAMQILVNNGSGSLTAGQMLVTGTAPIGIVAADFNGDGVVDLATADSGSNQVSVSLNDAGTLQPVVTVPLMAAPSGLAAGDVDNDGDLDLIAATDGDGQLLINNGSGVFTDQSLPLTFGSDVAVADFNRDGNLDAAFRSDFQITFYLGNGTGTFAEGGQRESNARFGGLAVADMDNDGRPDLAFTRDTDQFGDGDSTVGFLLNGSGSYVVNLPAGATVSDLINLQSVDHLGFSLDSDPNVSDAAGNDISMAVPHISIPVTGADAYELYSFTVENAGDRGYFDIDDGVGADDLDTVLYLFDEAGNLLATDDDSNVDPGSADLNFFTTDSLLEYTFDAPGIYVIAVADFSNEPLAGPNGIAHKPIPAGADYTLHIAIESHPLGIVPMSPAPEDVFSGALDFGNFPLPGSVSGVKFDDLNENGVQEMGEAGLGGFVIYADLDNDGTHDPGEPSTITAGDGSWSITDLPAFEEYTIREVQQAGFVQTTPDGLQFSTTEIDSSSPFAVTAFDVDGQFGEDLIVTDEFNARLMVYLRQANGSFGAPAIHNVGAGPVKVVAEHLDNDSNVDLVVVNETAGSVSVLRGAGLGGFNSAVTYAVGSAPVDVALADVGGDGQLDVLVANVGSDNFSVLINDGMGGFGTAMNTGTGVGTQPAGVAAAFIDGDAIIDVVIAAEGTDQLLVFPGLGGGSFGPGASISLGTGAAPSSVLATDLDGDEVIDLVTTDEGLGRISVLLGDSGNIGQFLSPVTYSVLPFPHPLIEGDFNGDALLDLAVVHDDNDQISVLLGNGDGTLQPALFFETGSAPGGIAAIDLNGDERDDLAVTATDEGPGVIELRTSEINVHVVDLEPGEDVTGLLFGNTPINDPPVINTPGPQATNEDTNLVFSSDELNAITISDPDVGAGVVEVTLTVTLGDLSLGTTAGLSFAVGDGSGDSTMIFTGTPGSVNFALENMTYAPPAGVSGASTLTVEVDDLGNTGAGCPNVVSKSVSISITAVNDPPMISVPSAQTVEEDDSLSFAGVTSNAIVVSDSDAGGADLEVDLSVADGTL